MREKEKTVEEKSKPFSNGMAFFFSCSGMIVENFTEVESNEYSTSPLFTR